MQTRQAAVKNFFLSSISLTLRIINKYLTSYKSKEHENGISKRREKEEKKDVMKMLPWNAARNSSSVSPENCVFFLISIFLSIDLAHANKLKCKLNRYFKEMMNVCEMIENRRESFFVGIETQCGIFLLI